MAYATINGFGKATFAAQRSQNVFFPRSLVLSDQHRAGCWALLAGSLLAVAAPVVAGQPALQGPARLQFVVVIPPALRLGFETNRNTTETSQGLRPLLMGASVKRGAAVAMVVKATATLQASTATQSPSTQSPSMVVHTAVMP